MNDRALVASLDALHPCLLIVKRYVSKFLETKVHFFEVLALQPNSTVTQFPRPQAHGWMVGVNGDVQLVGVVANQFKFNSVANKRQPWCIVVDGFCVVRIQGGQRYRDVLLGDAQFGPEVPQCFRLNAAIAQAREGRQTRVVPTRVAACLNVGSHLRRGKSTPLVNFNSSPVHCFGVRPAKVFVQQGLLPRGVHEVFSADDVRNTLKVVFNGALKIKQRPNHVLGADLRSRVRVRCCVLNTEGRPVPQGRVLQGHVRFNANDGLAGFEFPVQHAFPQHEVVLDVLRAARAIGFRYSELLEGISRAPTNVAKALFDHFGGVLMIEVDSIRCNHDPVGFSSNQPRRFFLNAFVGFQQGRLNFGVRVVKPQNEFTVVHCSEGAVDHQAPGMAKRKRAVWVGSKPQHDVAFLGVFQLGQTFPASLHFSLFEEVGRFVFKHGADGVHAFRGG